MVRLRLSDAEVMSAGVGQRQVIEAELNVLGFSAPGKIYAVYYDGGHQFGCGDGFQPPQAPGSVVALYLRGPQKRYENRFAISDVGIGYREFAMLHELFHGFGVVASCGQSASGGHVTDSPSDLMYAGALPWTPSLLDVNRDHYFKHGRPCADVSASPYLRLFQ